MNTFRLHREDAKTRRLDEAVEALGHKIVSAAFQVHQSLGSGLLESVYESCLLYELSLQQLSCQRQVSMPVHYKSMQIDSGLRLDLVIEDKIGVELKAVDQLLPVHQAQLMTYLKLSGHSLGFLINFNVPLIKDRIKRIIFRHQAS